ncbi:hypothetical protein KI743_15465 [Vibrio sp. D420a]|uniref:hypothetical protein n=1 Tax=Vibrio sp. D420a TaxID=2836895 RepID=UPI002555B3A9|nr:hypothetical protein [Vibrio sp. D420a]MDK9763401.1 hypothetical protein [Vibrio sp. D420a]
MPTAIDRYRHHHRLKEVPPFTCEQGLMFTVSQEVEKLLEKEVKKVERRLSIDEEINNNLEDLGGLNIDKMMKSMD